MHRSSPRASANDFRRQWEDVREDVLKAVDRVGRSGWLVLGEEVEAFEREIASWWGVPHAVGVASGLDALEIALRCAGVSAGQRVVTTPLTAFATTLAIVRCGAEPVWCDVDESGGLDLNQVDAALSQDPSIRAVLPVHLYGHPMDLIGLERLATEHDVVVVEDCAQSAGAERNGKPTATAGLAAGTSLYPTKNLGTMGDGGIVFTEDEEVAKRARRLRDYGQESRYRHVDLGMNSRLDELHASILRSAFLPRLGGSLARRRETALRYMTSLRDSALRPIVAASGVSAHHLFPVEVTDGDPNEIATLLNQRGVAVGRHYPFLCCDQPAVQGIGISRGSLPVAKRLAQRELSLPIHPYLDDSEIDLVIHACAEVCR